MMSASGRGRRPAAARLACTLRFGGRGVRGGAPVSNLNLKLDQDAIVGCAAHATVTLAISGFAGPTIAGVCEPTT